MCDQPNQIGRPAPAVPPAAPPAHAPVPPRTQDVAGMLLHSRKFWIAIFAVVQTIVFASIPDFPPAVWQSIDALASVLIAAYAYNDGPGPTR